MTRPRRWLSLEPHRSEQGVTFVELIISIVLLSMVTGGIASAFVTSLNGSGPSQARVREANDAQVVAAFLVRDAQAAGGIDPNTGSDRPDARRLEEQQLRLRNPSARARVQMEGPGLITRPAHPCRELLLG